MILVHSCGWAQILQRSYGLGLRFLKQLRVYVSRRVSDFTILHPYTLFQPILTYCSEVWCVYDKYDLTSAGQKTQLEKRTFIFVRCV